MVGRQPLELCNLGSNPSPAALENPRVQPRPAASELDFLMSRLGGAIFFVENPDIRSTKVSNSHELALPATVA